MQKSLLLILFFSLSFCKQQGVFAQNKFIDSLFQALKTPSHDTVKVKTLVALSEVAGWRIGKFDTGLILATQGKELAQKINYKVGLANAHNNIANVHYLKGNYDEAIKNYIHALSIHKETGFIKGIANVSNNIGNIYSSRGVFPEALKYYFSALKIVQEKGDKKLIALFYNNIGMVYDNLKNLPEALTNYKDALEIQKKIGDIENTGTTYFNIGRVYTDQKKYTEAFEQYAMAQKVFEEYNDAIGVAHTHQSRGTLYSLTEKKTEALEEYFKALEIYEKIKYNRGLAYLYNNIGAIYAQQQNFKKALPWLNKGLVLAIQVKDREQLRISYLSLSKIDSSNGDYKNAYAKYKLYEAFKDSLLNEENTKKIVQAEMRFEFDKKQTADSLIVAEERVLNSVRFQQEKQQRYFLYGGLIVFALFAAFMYNRFKVSQKQKHIINNQKTEVEAQKKLVDTKQKEILDSIYYARKIQMAQIPSEKQVEKSLERLKKLRS